MTHDPPGETLPRAPTALPTSPPPLSHATASSPSPTRPAARARALQGAVACAALPRGPTPSSLAGPRARRAVPSAAAKAVVVSARVTLAVAMATASAADAIAGVLSAAAASCRALLPRLFFAGHALLHVVVCCARTTVVTARLVATAATGALPLPACHLVAAFLVTALHRCRSAAGALAAPAQRWPPPAAPTKPP